jgi:squalene-associated FAD-dependent desaturase
MTGPAAARSAPRVVIVGGGWSGLATAVELARQGLMPTLLESGRQLGGRARAVRFGPFHVDNGQHMLLGAFSSVLDMLRTLGVAEASVFRRLPLRLVMVERDGRRLEIGTARLPAPLHLAGGMLRAGGLSLGARLRALQLLRAMRRQGFTVEPDRSVAEYLATHRQSPEALRAVWRPLCLAALNTAPEEASTRLFLRVVRDAFFAKRRHSDLLLPILDLSACLPRPATDYIESCGGAVRLGARVSALHVADGVVAGVYLPDEHIAADHVVIATPPDACAQLLRDHARVAHVAEAYPHLVPEPICTVFLRYPKPVALERDMVGLLDGTAHWLFDRGRLTGDRGLIAAVINGRGPHLRLTNEALIDRVVRDIAGRFPRWPAPLETKLIRERSATLAARPGIDRYRPAHATGVKGLWIAGDYTATGYPSSLEGAVRSGVLCARWILRHAHATSHPPVNEERP